MSKDIFEAFYAATVKKYRFTTPTGRLSVEQLHDLPLSSKVATTSNLNSIAVGLDREIAAAGENKRIASSKPSEEVLNKLAIVEYIMEAKQTAAVEAKEAKKKAEQKQIILTKIDEMETAELTDGKSVKQLKKQLEKL